MKQATKETAVITPAARVKAARLAIRAARPGRLISLLLWAVQIWLVYLFVAVAAGGKLAGTHFEVEQFAHIGAGQWLRYFVGIAELAGGIGLLTPWFAGLAAAGLAADMVGATIINGAVLHSNPHYAGTPLMTAILCAVFVLIAYARRRQIKALWAAIRR